MTIVESSVKKNRRKNEGEPFYYYATVKGKCPPKGEKWSNNINTAEKLLNKVITRAETKYLPQEIIDLTGFTECTNKPEKKHKFGLMASEKASDNKAEEAKHSFHASAPANLSSSTNHCPAYSPSSWFDSPEANIMFQTQATEQNALEAIQNKIKLLCSANETANSLSNVLEETEDGEVLLEIMTEGQKHLIRTKIIILIFALQSASKNMPNKTWRQCCEWAISKARTIGFTSVTNAQTVKGWYRKF